MTDFDKGSYVPMLERRPRTVAPAVYGWDAGKLAHEQERKATDAHRVSVDLTPTVYKLYTEDRPNLLQLVGGMFNGATIYYVTGIWQGETEHGAVIEILEPFQYRDKVVRLAAAIADANDQSEVIVTWQSSHGFEQVRVFGKGKV